MNTVAKSKRAEAEETKGAANEAGDPAATYARHIGGELKRVRLAKGLSLASLAKASGVSVGMLSQIERNLSNPSLRLLTQIRTALDVPASALFADSPVQAPDPAFVRRKAQHPRLDLGYFTKELLSSGSPHNLQLMILHIPPKGSSGGQPTSYAAEKGGMVLEGELTLKIGEEEALLKEGDSFVFDSLIPHSFVNASKTQVARVLWVIGKVPVERHL